MSAYVYACMHARTDGGRDGGMDGWMDASYGFLIVHRLCPQLVYGDL